MHFLVCVMFHCVCYLLDKNMDIPRKHKAKMFSLILSSRDNPFSFVTYIFPVFGEQIYIIYSIHFHGFGFYIYVCIIYMYVCI